MGTSVGELLVDVPGIFLGPNMGNILHFGFLFWSQVVNKK